MILLSPKASGWNWRFALKRSIFAICQAARLLRVVAGQAIRQGRHTASEQRSEGRTEEQKTSIDINGELFDALSLSLALALSLSSDTLPPPRPLQIPEQRKHVNT